MFRSITVLHRTRLVLTYRYFTSRCKQNYEVIIIGGGLMGLSSAYFLARRINPSSICVVERDSKVYKNVVKRMFILSVYLAYKANYKAANVDCTVYNIVITLQEIKDDLLNDLIVF